MGAAEYGAGGRCGPALSHGLRGWNQTADHQEPGLAPRGGLQHPFKGPLRKGSARIAAMKRRELLGSLSTIALLPAADWLGSLREKSASAPNATSVYELRVYRAYEGKLDDLLRRFRDHTIALFSKHNMKSIAYWTATDEPLKSRTLVYILEHPSKEAATANWQAFEDDPTAKRARQVRSQRETR